jgi:uncharacterized protein YecE (DUF72 family)
MMAREQSSLLIGTSGFSYDDWAGPFYPESLPQRERLAYYAQYFPFTEINFSYYRMPSARRLAGMLERVPEHFVFSVKAHGSLTHERPDDWRSYARRFAEAVTPLIERTALGGVLLQFPYSFHYTPGNRRYLDELCRELAALPRFLEFRNEEWQRDSVYAHMRRLGVGYVVTDLPRLRGLPESTVTTTNQAAYLRFHGRNAAKWWQGDNRSRYDYSYSIEELRPWAETVRELMTQVTIIMVAFNNHADGHAVANARDLQGLLNITP